MTLIKINPVVVALNTTANAVAIQVLTLDIKPQAFKLNARLFNVEPATETTPENKTEVANIPFELPIEDYDNWQTDEYLETKSLQALNLTKA